MQPSEKEILEDLLVAAHADARRKAEAEMQERMKALTGGLKLPPGMRVGVAACALPNSPAGHFQGALPPCRERQEGEGAVVSTGVTITPTLRLRLPGRALWASPARDVIDRPCPQPSPDPKSSA